MGTRWTERLVFDSTAEGGFAVYVVRASGGKPVRLTFGPGTDGEATWSHDGNRVYFHSLRNGQAQLWKVPAEGGEAVQVTENGGEFPVESRDGKFVYFQRGDGVDNISLWKIPVGGGMASQVLPSVTYVNFELMDDGIYFIPQPDSNGKAQLQFLSLATNSVKTVATLPGRIFWGLAVSPDHRWALYTRDDEAGSDLMLVENFK